jgi:hypothetical protein
LDRPILCISLNVDWISSKFIVFRTLVGISKTGVLCWVVFFISSLNYHFNIDLHAEMKAAITAATMLLIIIDHGSCERRNRQLCGPYCKTSRCEIQTTAALVSAP